jgi:ATP-dependent Clp protease, protease subunit
MSRKLNRDDLEKYHDLNIHVPTRTIYIGSEGVDSDGSESGVDFLLAEKAIKNLHILDSAAEEPINIILNNIGGDEFHGMAIYDAIRKCRSHVTIKGTGNIMSMATLIMQAGDKRILSKYSVFMLHHGHGTESGHVKEIRSWVEFRKRYDEILNDIYLVKIREKNPDFSRKKLEKLLDFDTILLPKEVVELGLADEVEGDEPQK